MFVRTYVQLLQMYNLLSRAIQCIQCVLMRYLRVKQFSIMINTYKSPHYYGEIVHAYRNPRDRHL
jgi:hypothetical protein